MTRKVSIIGLAFLPVWMQPVAAEPTESTFQREISVQFIPANDNRFNYEGRFDLSDPTRPAVVWQGSRIRLDFEGPRLALCFDGAMGQCFFDVQLDEAKEIVAVREGAPGKLELALPPGNGRHRLTLFKRSEAAAGHVRFTGVEIAPGARAWAPAPPVYRLRMEFFGDSIMVGACNEDGAVDQWEDRRTHNHALSYTTLTSAAFAADHRCMAVSGMGIATGYVEVLAGQVWDKILPRADSPRADLRAWRPDVAFVNFGENDDSFSRSQGRPFPANYTVGYVALVKAMRAAYPRTQIVLLRGGMYGGAKNPELAAAWHAAVTELEAGDPAISHYVFAHWSSNHPRVSDDRIMADELTKWLKEQPFMTSFL